MSQFESLANHFLIAMPNLRDPNFARTVTLICEHSPEGAMGIVINVSRASEQETRETASHFSDVVDLKKRRDARPARWTPEQQNSKPVGGFESKPVGTKMAVRNSKTRRAKRARRE